MGPLANESLYGAGHTSDDVAPEEGFLSNTRPKLRVRRKTGVLITLITLLFLAGCGGGGGSDDLLSATANGSTNGSPIGNGSGKATLSWDGPTTNMDGSPLSNLAGFKLYYGTSSPINASNSTMIDVGNTTSYTIIGLDAGTYFFIIKAYNDEGSESEFSNEASKAI